MVKLIRHGSHAFEGRSSRHYNRWATGPLRWAYRALARDIAAAMPPSGTVLDVGTGPGVLLVELARLRPDIEVIGIDISPDMIAMARGNLARFEGRATAQIGDVANLPIPDGQVDLAVSSLSLHHWDNPAAAVSELARVLRPGGRTYIYDIRGAPFDALLSAAHAKSLFTGDAPRQASVRLGWLPVPRLTRLELTS
jgi:ubiquinone/menaquinone biosynthesis C-methylase UbiE